MFIKVMNKFPKYSRVKVVREGAHRKNHSTKHKAEHLWKNGRELIVLGYSRKGYVIGRLVNQFDDNLLQDTIIYVGEDELELIHLPNNDDKK